MTAEFRPVASANTTSKHATLLMVTVTCRSVPFMGLVDFGSAIIRRSPRTAPRQINFLLPA